MGITVQLTDEEDLVVMALATEADMSYYAVVRQALRHYQFKVHRIRQGYRPKYVNADGNEHPDDNILWPG